MNPEEIRDRRENAAQRLAVGSAMLGGAAVAHHEVKRRTGIKGPVHLVRDMKGGAKPKHGKYAAGWLATRGVTAAGLPLAVSGASNLLAKRPKTEEGVDVRRDVLRGSVGGTKPNIQVTIPKNRRTLEQKATAAAPIVGGAALGGYAGRKLASKVSRNKGSKARIAAMGIGAGLGSAFGASAAIPATRHAVDVASSGRYRYSPKTGIQRREVHKSQPGAIRELPKGEQQTLIRQKKKQSKYSLTSAALGLSAFGLKSPALVGAAAKRSKTLAQMKPVQRFAGHAPKADKYATNLGIASLGVGGMGSLNFARIQRAEAKADQKATGIKKGEINEAKAKALVNIEKRDYARERNGRFARGGSGGGKQSFHSDKAFNAHLNTKMSDALKLAEKNNWNTDETWQHFVMSLDHKELDAMSRRRPVYPGFEDDDPGWPEGMWWSESVGDTEGSEETIRHIAAARDDWSGFFPEHRPKGWVPKSERVKKRVLVTGSRDWDDEPEVHRQLDRLAAEHPDIEVIEGGARGADTHARNWARKNKRKVTTYQADWKTHGRSAGPKRNQRMLDEGTPDRVIAFSRDLANSKGTKDMVRRAKRAKLPTEVYGQDVAKALFPARMFRPRPLGFGGVRAGGIRRTPTGRLVTYRGSMG